MTHERDIERLLDRWLSDGATEAPDRVLGVVADRIERQPQRPAWRLDWRRLTMNPTVKIAAGIAAILIVAVIGYNLLPGASGGIGGPAPTRTSSPAPPAPSSSTSAPATFREGPLSAGDYVLRPFAPAHASLSITLTVPDGWQGFGNWAVIPAVGTGAPNGMGLGFLMASGLFSDPCHWDRPGVGTFPQPGDITVGPTVDDLVTALTSHSGYTATAPTDVEVGGYSGKRLDLQLPSTVDLASCDRVSGSDTGAYFVWGTSDPAGNDLYAQGPGQQFRLWILDVAGARVIIVNNDFAGTSEQDRAAAEAIIDSITIQP